MSEHPLPDPDQALQSLSNVQVEGNNLPGQTVRSVLGEVAIDESSKDMVAPALVGHSEQDNPRVEEPDYPIVWPHTVGAAAGLGKKVAVTNMRMQVPNPWSPHNRRERVMRKINGSGSEVLADKYSFIELMHRMGYNAPRQLRVETGEPVAQKVARSQEVFGDPDDPIICKPPQGSGGKNIVELTASRLPAFLEKVDEPYIIQERVPHELEIRYVRDIDPEAGRIHRVYFEKGIPKIEADGVSTVRELVKQSGMGFGSRMITYMKRRGTLSVVMPEGSKIHVSQFGGNPTQTPEWGPGYEERVANVDRFMHDFLSDLQTEIGHPLPLLCFDLGFRDASVLDKPYDLEAIKASMVPFECQMPFTITGYIQHSRRNPSGEPGK